MRRLARGLGLVLGLVLTAALTGLEALLAWNWFWLTLYVMEDGRAENPYAAEDADIAGICALLLLPLCLAALAWVVYEIVARLEKAGGSPDGEIEAKKNADNLL